MFHYFKNKKNNQGFSLMELIIGVAIIGIMSAVGFASVVSIRRNSALKSTQDKVVSAIKLMQTQALQGKTVGSAKDVPCEFGFKFTDSEHYKTFYKLDCTATNENDLAVYNLTGGVELKDPSEINKTSLNFSVPNANLTGPITRTFVFGFNSGASDEASITINPGGLIDVN